MHTHKQTHMSSQSDSNEKDSKSIQMRYSDENTYPILFKGKLKYPMIWHPKRNTNISHLFAQLLYYPVSLTVSPSLILIPSLTFSILYLPHISHFWQSHQLLHPKVTVHTQYVHSMLPSARESKMNIFSYFNFHITPQHTSWENKSKSHQNIPMNLWDSNLSKHTLSLLLFLPLSDLWGVGVKF